MSEAQRQFYMEQAQLCERAAAEEEDAAKIRELLERRDSWLTLAKLIAPPRRFKWASSDGGE
ncbi:hypothetical protein [Novosphingobium sp. JCM 18896]|uniref:hypothetical protein n=1 Tax=Novosphingobium sp. JCM 18896 TaxID=2989731 RepID=UPI002223CEA7|nr:hypothetical protein [Novosphingobium sp. JCM 18896]